MTDELPRPDFIPAAHLAALTQVPLSALYNDHSSGKGPFAGLLTKLGGRLGCWREDYEAWKAARLLIAGKEQPAPSQSRAAAAP